MSKIRDLKEQIKDLERTIGDLRNEAEFQVRRHLLECEGVRTIEERKFYENTINLKIEEAKCAAKIAEVEKRWDSSIQKQQEAIIKALIVKLPAVDIKEIHSHCKGE